MDNKSPPEDEDMPILEKIEWKPITEPNLHGETATVGNLKAEVVRAYEGEWLWFPWQDGKQVVTGKNGTTMTKAEARKLASVYLRGGKPDH